MTRGSLRSTWLVPSAVLVVTTVLGWSRVQDSGQKGTEGAPAATQPATPAEPGPGRLSRERLLWVSDALRERACAPIDVMSFLLDVVGAARGRSARAVGGGWFQLVSALDAEDACAEGDGEREVPIRLHVTGIDGFRADGTAVLLFELEIDRALFGAGDTRYTDDGTTLVSGYARIQEGVLVECSALVDVRAHHTQALEGALRSAGGVLLRGASTTWKRGEDGGEETATWRPFWVTLDEAAAGNASSVVTSLGNAEQVRIEPDGKARAGRQELGRELCLAGAALVEHLVSTR